jgi:hypothetical protein
LEPDLGTGVRLVRPKNGNRTESEIQNKFWGDSGEGVAPLLFGMGATTLAFFPTRKAVMVEGPSDIILLPKMFRESLKLETLGFQCVHGLSNLGASVWLLALGGRAGVLYLTDGDPGGITLRQSLLDGGCLADDVFTLTNSDCSAVELEDFIDPPLLVSAANTLLGRFYPDQAEIKAGDLSNRLRMESLEHLFAERTGVKLPKVELAYEVIDLLDKVPGSRVLDQRRKKTFDSISQGILNRFEALSATF